MNDAIVSAYEASQARLLLLDYDGVLAPITSRPALAAPTKQVIAILEKLSRDRRNCSVVISGRPHDQLQQWLGALDLDFAAEHGHYVKDGGGSWRQVAVVDEAWKRPVRQYIEQLCQTADGSFIEEKTSSLVWHYRAVAPNQLKAVLQPGMERLEKVAANHNLILMNGKKVIEIKTSQSDKGTAARHWLQQRDWDFILAAGDDVTDEDMFMALPRDAYSIKIGPARTAARCRLKTQSEFIELLERLT